MEKLLSISLKKKTRQNNSLAFNRFARIFSRGGGYKNKKNLKTNNIV
jgi:hypothetical protein